MTKQKLFSLFTMFLVLSTWLWAGGRGDRPASGGTSASSISKEFTLPIVNQPVTLTIMARENQTATAPTYSSGQLAVWNEIERITGIKINWECTIQADYPQAVQTRLAAGVGLPDMMTIPDPVPYLNQGIIIPLDGLINDYAPDLKKIFEDNKDVKAAMSGPDGSVYCIPTIPKEINTVHTRMLVIRKDWLDRLGLQVPVTMDDWYTVLKAFKEKDADGDGNPNNEVPYNHQSRTNLADERGFSAAFGMELAYANGWHVGNDGKVFYDYKTQNGKDFITFIHRLVAEGLMISTDDNTGRANIANGMVGAYDGWPDSLTATKQLLVTNSPNANLIPVPFPTTKYNNKPTSVSPYPVYEYAASMFITKDCKQPEIAIKWLNFLFSQQGQYLTNFGVEGQHYTLQNGRPVINDFYLHNPDGRAPSEVQRYIGCRPSIPFLMSRDFEEQIKQLDPFSAASIPIIRAASRPPSFPSVMPSPQEVSALRAVQADFDTFVSEQVSKFIMGERPIAEYDRFMNELDGMGLQDILKVKQAQYDRYRNMTK
jgi:putative aldouronate transport system substrate-binding protein